MSKRTGRPGGSGLIRGLLVLVMLCCAAGSAPAADVQLEATVDRNTVAMDGQIVYTVTVSGGLKQPPSPQLPPLENDWTVYSGGTSRSFSMVNGNVSSSAAYRYVLTPKKTGSFTIGRATLKVGSETFESNPITVTVTAASGGNAAPSAGPAPGEQRSDQADRDLFVTTSVDDKTPYVHEQVILTFRFYQRVNLLESPNYTAPATTGFWSEDLPPQRTFNEVLNGRRYYVTEVRTALFPTSPGEFTIGPATLDCVVPQVNRSMDRDPFSMFGQSMFNSRKVTLRSQPITMKVKPLPDGAPDGFKGAVGAYAISADVDKTSLPQGDPVTLKLTVKGTGNVKTVPDLDLPELKEFKIYDSSSSSDVSKTGGTLSGTKIVEQILVPLKAGAMTIPPVSLVYFDPAKGEYRTTATAPIELAVTPAAVSAGGLSDGANRGRIEVVGQDIRFIRTSLGGVRNRGAVPWTGAPFWLMHLLSAGLVVGALIYEGRRKKLEGDQGFARDLRSGREAGRRLKRARSLVGSDANGFYGEVAAALRGYVADKFNRSAAGLTLEDIDGLLAGRAIGDGIPDRLRAFLEACDRARFAPVADGAGDRERLLEEAAGLIQSLKKAGL